MLHLSLRREGERFGFQLIGLFVMFLIGFAMFGTGLEAQTFSSGSTGADGALSYTTPGTYYFDPRALNIDPAHDNIFNFTTINIAAGVTLKISSKVVSGPVYWLATGDVTIAGTVDLSGEDGIAQLSTLAVSSRVPSVAGSGGYGGGLGGMSGGSPAQPGNGPGGGVAATTTIAGGGAGTNTSNQFVLPLFGGSGGGGGLAAAGTFGGEGGAGGGALLIASSTRISLSSCGPAIIADGGHGGGCDAGGTCGGPGAGGSVRLVSNMVTEIGCLVVVARGARGNNSPAGDGKIRLESFSGTLPTNSNLPMAITSTPDPLLLPSTPPPTMIVTAINGVPINANPFAFPDITINTSSPIVINIEAHYVPLGTIPKVTIFSEGGPDQVVNASVGLAGTLAVSTTTATITFPTGGSRGFVKATW